MAILFVDGFDHYQTSDIKYKWDNMDSMDPLDTYFWVDNTSPRTGGQQYMRLSNRSNGGSTTFVGSEIKKLLPVESQTLVTGFAFNIVEFNGNLFELVLKNANAQVIVKYRFIKNANFDKFGVQVVDHTDTVIGVTSDAIFDDNVWYYMETKTSVNNTTGSCQVRINGATHLQIDNIDTDPSNGVHPTVNYIEMVTCTTPATAVTTFIDDLYLLNNIGLSNNDFLGDVYIQAILPNGAGAHSDWSPSSGANYECVDDIDIDNDVTFVSTTTDNAIDTYEFQNVTAITGSTIKAVVANIVAKKDGAAIRHIAPIARLNNLEYEGDNIDLVDSYKLHQHIWENKPSDGTSWETTDIDNGQFGVKLTPNTP